MVRSQATLSRGRDGPSTARYSTTESTVRVARWTSGAHSASLRRSSAAKALSVQRGAIARQSAGPFRDTPPMLTRVWCPMYEDCGKRGAAPSDGGEPFGRRVSSASEGREWPKVAVAKGVGETYNAELSVGHEASSGGESDSLHSKVGHPEVRESNK
jgi:hypothetical protein